MSNSKEKSKKFKLKLIENTKEEGEPNFGELDNNQKNDPKTKDAC